MSYTPGPWIQYGCTIFEVRGRQRQIAWIVKSGAENEELEYANAHLIASAPDMYDLLQGMVTMHMLEGKPAHNQFLIDKIEAVLKKARGE